MYAQNAVKLHGTSTLGPNEFTMPCSPQTANVRLQLYIANYCVHSIQGVTLQDKPPQSHRHPEAYQVSPG